ncbi:TMV resistance protein N, partial [Mucuna pruriens]
MANIHDDTTTSSDFKYDVFLCFTEEKRYPFIDYLYQALLDDETKSVVRYDKVAHSPLDERIDKSRMSIIVLCENYARSTLCLDLLVKIMECYDAKRNRVLPIFYKVEPSDVWDLKNSFATIMSEYAERFGHDSDKVKAWRSALSRIRHLDGEHCKDYKYESGLIRKIVKEIYAKLPPSPVLIEIKHPVGLDSCCEQVKKLLDIESNDTTCMLAIYGDSGLGKTTLAAYVYNQIRLQFEAGSFLAGISKKSNNSIDGLKILQKTLLYEIGEKTQTTEDGKGSSQIKCKLSHKKVVLVLDDVDTLEQLESLAGGRDWFGSGSKIIITTKDTTLLDEYHVEVKKYKMEELNSHDSLQLFSWYAFNMDQPLEKYADISNSVVSYAKGVPSALIVLGSHLKCLSVEEWEMALKKYRMVPNSFSFLVSGCYQISLESLYFVWLRDTLDNKKYKSFNLGKKYVFNSCIFGQT